MGECSPKPGMPVFGWRPGLRDFIVGQGELRSALTENRTPAWFARIMHHRDLAGIFRNPEAELPSGVAKDLFGPGKPGVAVVKQQDKMGSADNPLPDHIPNGWVKNVAEALRHLDSWWNQLDDDGRAALLASKKQNYQVSDEYQSSVSDLGPLSRLGSGHPPALEGRFKVPIVVRAYLELLHSD